VTDLIVHPAEAGLTGSVPVPSDKSIGHRALLFSAICTGRTKIGGMSWAADNTSTADALRAMGVRIERVGKSGCEVDGVGIFGLKGAAAPLDCGNSGTTMRLLTGLLAPQPFTSTLIGDASLSRRPMMRIVGPLRSRGARIDGQKHPTKDDVTAPLTIHGLPQGTYLGPIEFESPVSSAQVKSAILLSGLYAHGPTYFKEPTVSRDHTERMLLALGVPLRTMGTLVELDPSNWKGQMSAFQIEIPGDLSAAAFLLVAAQLVKGSRVTTRAVGINPTRTGLLEIARDMGAKLLVEPSGECAGEPIAEIHSEPGDLRAGRIGGEVVARAIDEIPIACALAARANGTTVIRDAQELRVKESDRIASMAGVLRAFGVKCDELPDGIEIEGSPRPLTPADVESHGDHRIAMTSVVLALLGSGPSRVRDVDCIVTSFPRFVGTMRALGARIDVEGTSSPFEEEA
jgi:3-phosphoshikimate 1-carboxyvinyltransferase